MAVSPLVQKAFDDIATTAEFATYANPHHLRRFQERMCAIIEDTIDAPAEQKEAMKIAAILGIGGSPFVFPEVTENPRLMKSYGREVAKIAKECHRSALAQAMMALGNASPTPLQLQMKLVVQIVADEDFAATTVNDMTITPDIHGYFADMRTRVLQTLPNLQAPKLAALYQQTQQNLFTALDAALEKQLPKPDAPKPDAPKP